MVRRRGTWTGIGLAATCLLLALVPATMASADTSPLSDLTAGASARVGLRPSTVQLGQSASIVVSHVRTRSVQVLLKGATDDSGRQLQWRSLRLVDGAWRGTLPAPALRGVYPVVLRIGEARFIESQRWLLRVYEPGTTARPSFEDPVDVVDWWVSTIPGGTLVAVKEWPRPDFDHRDPDLHRLFVVAYSSTGDPAADDVLGTFVTAVRDGYQGRWRFLEATVEP